MIGATILAALAIAQPAAGESQGAPPTYFPPSLTTPIPVCVSEQKAAVDAFKVAWYSWDLRAAGEPSFHALSLDSKHAPGVAIRFTWLRSFHPPVVIRAEGLGSRAPGLTVKQLSGTGGNAPGTVSRESTRALSLVEARKLVGLIGHVTFLQPLVAAPLGPCDRRVKIPGLDGAQWVIEVVDKDGYHFADAQSPEEGGLRALGTAMMSLTGWDFGQAY